MSPRSPPPRTLPDLLEALREEIALRWRVGVGSVLGALVPPEREHPVGMRKLVAELGAVLRTESAETRLAHARALGREHGRERYLAGFSMRALVLEYGALRSAIFDTLEAEGWTPGLAELRALNQVLDIGLEEAVGQSSLEDERAPGAWLHGLLDHAPTVVYAKDTAGRYLYVNHGFEKASGLLRRDVVGRTDHELFSAEVAEIFSGNDRQVLVTGKQFTTDEHVSLHDGVHVFQTLKFPLPDAQGRVMGVCGFSTDSTEAKRLERERDEAREHLRRIVTQLPVVLWATDAQGVITLFEGERLSALGLERGAYVGRSAYDVYRDRPDLLAATMRAQEGESFILEVEMSGSWFMTGVSPVIGPDGNVVSVAGVSLDISERRRAEEVLRQSEMRYRLATLATSDVIYDWNLDTGDIEWSELAAVQFRLTVEEAALNVDGWSARIHPEDRERVAQDIQMVIDQGAAHWTDEYRFLRGDGSWAVIADRGQVVRDADGRAVRMVGAMQDISEQRATEQEAKRRAEFEQLLIGIVSHDLRNPLSAISMAATALLRRDGQDDRQRKALGRILSSAGRATRMLRDLLDFTQARLGGGIPMESQWVDLHVLTRHVVEEVRLARPERTLEFECRGDGYGAWDPDRLAQVITNLVNNALSYSPDGGVVCVRTRGLRDSVVLTVHNPGPPIDPELRPRMFEPMKRPEHKGPRGGLGLGLFIVKHIVDAHGGAIRVHSSAHDGTTFLVRLPRGTPPPTSDAEALAPGDEPG
ncbi:Chemotaxis protein methyltransferase CheR [Myxococcus hansupus]|uniref:histidine kinase n=1 Tax=Pseudomyxococcus hansupus TaxID=1297742 RepID=A0A0H4X6K4_9BACT|nr:PAS domain-containing sensor histidine kinase [Myxococcus hansupus]AKQ69533.1 Chemotaxis protein methyltransferase CheR [Myxococcus hansupus]